MAGSVKASIVESSGAIDTKSTNIVFRVDYQATVVDKNANSYKPIYASNFFVQSVRSSKENFSCISTDEALNLLKITPQHFDYINGEKNQSGFIAEDAEPFFPEICAYQKDEETGEEKLFGLDYSKFTPYVVKLLQTLYDKVATLEQEKEDLEERLRKVEDCLGI